MAMKEEMAAERSISKPLEEQTESVQLPCSKHTTDDTDFDCNDTEVLLSSVQKYENIIVIFFC